MFEALKLSLDGVVMNLPEREAELNRFSRPLLAT
jgi:hypothetical protein